MAVRAKFKVTSITQYDWNKEARQIKLQPVTSGSLENEEFFKTTPSGELSFTIANPEAFEQFSIGDFFYLDFSRADP